MRESLADIIALVRSDGRTRETFCPGHEDRKPSLSVSTGYIREIVLCCHAGCQTEAVLAAAGLSFADLGEAKVNGRRPRSPIVQTYDYTDANGRALFEVTRTADKQFLQRHVDHATGKRVWNIQGVPRVLYRLPELRGQSHVFLVEGEKDVETLRRHGLVATTSPMGAKHWQDAYATQFVTAGVGAVTALPDNDPPGYQYATSAAHDCQAAGVTVKLLALPGLPPKGDVSDWLAMGHTVAELLALVERTPLWMPTNGHPVDEVDAPESFRTVGDQHILTCPSVKVSIIVTQLRWSEGELHGSMTVTCGLPTARAIKRGVIDYGDINFTSSQTRKTRAKLLEQMAGTTRDQIDWERALLRMAVSLNEIVDAMNPSGVTLSDVPLDEDDATYDVLGLHLLRRQPSLLFGDGGAMKSYVALKIAGELARRGVKVGYFDWECTAKEHKKRLMKLFPDVMPHIRYYEMQVSLVRSLNQVRRNVAMDGMEWAVFDSIAYAVDGAPEEAAAATGYKAAVRGLGIGSLHLAHITKPTEHGDHRKKPFGSVFWNNMGRAAWYLERGDKTPDGVVPLRLFGRKDNDGDIGWMSHLAARFEGKTRLTICQVPRPVDIPDGSVWQRMTIHLVDGALRDTDVATALGVSQKLVRQEAKRHPDVFRMDPLESGIWIGLAQPRLNLT